MRPSRIDALTLKARIVGLHLVTILTPPPPRRSLRERERRERVNFHFYRPGPVEGRPLFSATNAKMAGAFIRGYAEARMQALRAELAGETMRSAFGVRERS
jgi:hypothetical protein